MKTSFRAFAVAAIALCSAACSAVAGETPVLFRVETPDEVSSGTLWWGLMRQGRQIGQGELAIEPGEDDRNAFVFTGAAHEAITEAAPVTAWLCIGDDRWESFSPSVGDMHQKIALEHADGAWRVSARKADWRTRTLSRPDALLTVHYHRTDGTYEDVSLWTWDQYLRRAPEENELLPVGRDEFGLVFQLDTGLYGEQGDQIGLLPRRNADWQLKDNGDRMWTAEMGAEVYLVQANSEIYSEVPDVTPKVRRVTLDADHHLTVRFSHRLPAAEWTPDKFHVKVANGGPLDVRAVHPWKHRGDRCAMYSVETVQPLEYPQKTYEITVEGFGSHVVRAGHIIKDASRFCDPDVKLGAIYSPEGTTFRVFAPGALEAGVVVADEVEGVAGLAVHDMTESGKGIWAATVPGNLEGKYYAYRLTGADFNPEEEITDIYATCTQARHARALIVDLSKTDPPGFKDHTYRVPTSAADAIIYEMHVRDFTIAGNSGVEHRGKYAGLAESGTTLPDDPSIKTGLDHLVEMGVTHVQIMPVQDFDNAEHEGDSYNWGYMPVHFNSPDGWYALEYMGPGKIRELKSAIKAFHDRGIGVILDVVYNHTANWAPFEKLVPGYYFRMTDAGNFANGSGCGNEFASENPMARKFLLDSLKFWVSEYRVDGFRFDLMGLIDLETMKLAKSELQKMHPGILVYGEPWTGGSTPLKPITDKNHTRGTGIGAFNDHFRDAIKGDRDGGAPGFIQVGDRVDGVVKGLMGAVHDWAHDPVDSINYFEAHDNLTSWDKLLQSAPHAPDDVRKRMMRVGALVLFTAQGTAFMHSGQEFCRSKQGSHNSYNQPDEINQIDWSLKKSHGDVTEYHKGMIALRKAHPAFRLRTRAEVERRVTFMEPPNGKCIMYHIDAAGLEGESAQRILVIFNGALEPTRFPLPQGDWTIHADSDRAGLDALGKVQGEIEVPAHGGALLIR